MKYWLDVESLVYPDLPKHHRKQPVKTFKYADRLPWKGERGDPVAEDHKYFVYFGLVDRPILERELRIQFGAPPAAENFGGNQARPDNGRTFLCAVEVSANGHVAASTLQTAAFAAAFASKKHGRDIAHRDLALALVDLAAKLCAENPEGKPVDGAWFAALIALFKAELDWSPSELMAREQLCVQRVSLVRKDGKPLRPPPEIPPINSFYVDDLSRIAALAEQGRLAPQVQRFIDGDLQAHGRCDVTQLDHAAARLAAQRFPAGRWPSRFPLFMMQQVAVNGCFETLAEGGLFSVNGPPGTGKTTLLMDMIAARVVDRARVLATFATPSQAFTKDDATIEYPPSGNSPPRRGSSYRIDARLLDFGIVVASSNNNAVENITRDLPSIAKIDPAFAMLDDARFDYFGATANALFNPAPRRSVDEPVADAESVDADGAAPPPQTDEPIACWGLVSVPLGNKGNRNRVAYELGRWGNPGIAAALEAIDGAQLDWRTARARFNAALDKVEKLQEAVAEYDARMAQLQPLRARHAAAHQDALRAAQEAEAAHGALREAGRQDAALERRFSENMAERTLLATERSWWQKLVGALLRTREHGAFHARSAALGEEYDALRAARAVCRREHASSAERAKRGEQACESARRAAAVLRAELDGQEAACAVLAERLGKAAFDHERFAALPVAEQQKSLPRSNDALHVARAELFIAALALHKAFMKHAGSGFQTNFRLALSMLEGQAFLQPHLADIAPHLWATFFLAVPVVSSTFASFSRCFKDLGEGQIGLLLIDEAGQAVAAHALGAIWRSKRAVVVGDPLQVDPVIKMEPGLDLAILAHHGAREQHLLTRYSVQHLADRANRFGAQVLQYDGRELWVGSPLRVHRRCADPMFSLSNRIAYNDKMVFGPDPAEERRATMSRPLLGPSGWIDVDTGDFDEHYSATEGLAALGLVAEYARHGWTDAKSGLPDLFIISPFKSVKEGMGELLRERTGDWAGRADEETVSEWLKARVGTVHTFQGKECESVVFLLGGGSGGARQWAASRPNIVNVAATRAKRRLYVIGNRKAWQATVFGAELAQALPRIECGASRELALRWAPPAAN